MPVPIAQASPNPSLLRFPAVLDMKTLLHFYALSRVKSQLFPVLQVRRCGFYFTNNGSDLVFCGPGKQNAAVI